MKKLLPLTLGVALSFYGHTQDIQNPDFEISRSKYMAADSLRNSMNTTVQQTYTAYDWREDRKQRRMDRLDYRRYRWTGYYGPYAHQLWQQYPYAQWYGYNRHACWFPFIW